MAARHIIKSAGRKVKGDIRAIRLRFPGLGEQRRRMTEADRYVVRYTEDTLKIVERDNPAALALEFRTGKKFHELSEPELAQMSEMLGHPMWLLKILQARERERTRQAERLLDRMK